MTTNTMYATIEDLIKDVWAGDVLITDKAEAEKYANDDRLLKEGIMSFVQDDGVLFSRSNAHGRQEEPARHQYIMPPFADEVRAILSQAMDGRRGANLLLSGPAGTGKTEFVYEICRKMGFGRVFQVNGSDGLVAADFHGATGVKVDEASGQNMTVFEKGPLYRAFLEGTKLDADGNQVLDAAGEPIVTGAPGVFFLDEFAAMLPEVFLGVFNRVLEIPRDERKSRSMEVPGDGGRVVKSHPGMVLFLAGNTVGTGNSGKYQMGYTAQSNRMDESTLSRISAAYRFGYSRKAEEGIANRYLQDDYEVARVLSFCHNVRNMYREEKVERLFSTRHLVGLCRTAAIYKNAGVGDWMTKAIRDSVLNTLSEQDRPAFNETVRMIYSVDLDASGSNTEYDYI